MREFPVTFAIPVHCTTDKSLDWLQQCFDSVYETGAKISIWDDGSSKRQDVHNICEEFGVEYNGSVTNHGPAYARNMAVELADTELIIPLDCDDYVHPDIVNILYGEWLKHNKPTIPDVYKVFEDGTLKIHRLVEWSCEAQQQLLAIAPVTVLHSKTQWDSVGGWDERFTSTDVYEDCEYNNRLLSTYCAVNVRHPLLYYRQHSTSRLHSRTRPSIELYNKLKQGIAMAKGCCGKGAAKRVVQKRIITQSSNGGSQLNSKSADHMEEVQGEKVLVQYQGGKGKLTHTYRGPVTRTAHKVMHGDYLYVAPADAREPGASPQESSFVRVYKPKKVTTAKKKKTTTTKKTTKRTPRKSTAKKEPV